MEAAVITAATALRPRGPSVSLPSEGHVLPLLCVPAQHPQPIWPKGDIPDASGINAKQTERGVGTGRREKLGFGRTQLPGELGVPAFL